MSFPIGAAAVTELGFPATTCEPACTAWATGTAVRAGTGATALYSAERRRGEADWPQQGRLPAVFQGFQPQDGTRRPAAAGLVIEGSGHVLSMERDLGKRCRRGAKERAEQARRPGTSLEILQATQAHSRPATRKVGPDAAPRCERVYGRLLLAAGPPSAVPCPRDV